MSQYNSVVLNMEVAGRERSHTKLDFVTYPSKLYHARDQGPNRVSELFPNRLNRSLTGTFVERPPRRTVTPTITTTKVVELKLASRVLTVNTSTQTEAECMLSHVAKNTA